MRKCWVEEIFCLDSTKNFAILIAKNNSQENIHGRRTNQQHWQPLGRFDRTDA
jgi:hypothetical protein